MVSPSPPRALPLVLAAALLSVAVVAGCINNTDGGEELPDDIHGDLGPIYVNLPDEDVRADAAPYTTMVCREKLMALPFDASTGARVQDRCNYEVTIWNGPANEISMAVNPADPLNIVAGAKDYTLSDGPPCGLNNVWNGHYWSTDGGLTWGNGMMPGWPGGPAGPLTGNLCNTDPVLVFDGDGNPWYSGLNYRGATDPDEPQTGSGGAVTGSQVYFGRSIDGGATYPHMSFSSAGDNDNVFNDKQWFAIDPDTNHMYLTWTDFITPGGACTPTGCGQIMFSESIDGDTWTPPVGLFEIGNVQPIEQFSMPVVGPEGQVYVLWLNFNNPDLDAPGQTAATLFFTQGVPQTVLGQLPGANDSPATTFHPARALMTVPGSYFGPLPDHEFRSATLPVMAVDRSGGPTNGCLYIAWASLANGDADIWYTWSCNEGASWATPVIINDGPGDGTHQFMPWLDVGPDGSVHVVYYDERWATRDGWLDVSYAHSLDGETWSDDMRVSEVSFDPSWAYHQSGSNFIGDYIALDVSDLAVHLSWADTRHNTSDVYHAVIVKDPAAGAIYHAAPSTDSPEPSYYAQARWRIDTADNETALGP